MKYWDEKLGKWRETLERFILPFEIYDDLIFFRHWHNWCFHNWEQCIHDGVGSRGSHPRCQKVSPYKFWSHYICAVENNCYRKDQKGRFCDSERHSNKWGEVTTKILEKRRAIVEDREWKQERRP